MRKYLELFFLFFIWYFAGAAANVYCKNYLLEFPSPLNLTIVQYISGIIILGIMMVIAELSNLDKEPNKDEVISDGDILYSRKILVKHDWSDRFIPKLSVYQWRIFLIVGLVNGIGHLMTNSSMGEVAVSFTHTIKAGEPLFSILFSYFLLKSVVTIQMVLSLIPIVLGVGIATTTEYSFTLSGFMTAMASNALFSARNVFSKKLQTQSKMDNMQLYFWLSIIGLVILLPPMLLRILVDFLYPPLEKEDVSWVLHTQTAINQLIQASIYHTAYNYVSFLILGRISAVSHAIGNALRRIFIIVAALVWFQNSVTRWNIIGAVISSIGVALYSIYSKNATATNSSTSEAPTSPVRRFNV